MFGQRVQFLPSAFENEISLWSVPEIFHDFYFDFLSTKIVLISGLLYDFFHVKVYFARAL